MWANVTIMAKRANAVYEAGYVEFYDLISSSGGKDYAGEAAAVTELIRSRNPEARSLLDVACGSGEHLRHLRHLFDHVEGVDLIEPMVALAATKVPGIPLHTGDMRTLELSGRFDAVTCLYWSIGYMRDLTELAAAVHRLAAHLAPGGVLVVEPWAAPGEYDGGMVDHAVLQQDGRTVIQMIYSRPRQDRSCVLDMYNLIGDSDGVRSWTETHTMGLFTLDEYHHAFVQAGLDPVEAVRWQGKRERMVGVRPR
jgi:SAM-dependent methyltransferase